MPPSTIHHQIRPEEPHRRLDLDSLDAQPTVLRTSPPPRARLPILLCLAAAREGRFVRQPSNAVTARGVRQTPIPPLL